MQITAPMHVISAFHHVHERPLPSAPTSEAERITQKALADGWIAPPHIESFLIATDARLWQITTRELLAVFGIPLQPVFERPARGAKDAEGIDLVPVAEFCRLLIMLERAGMAIDPEPLCKALTPTYGAKRMLTATELMVYWRAAGRATEDLTFSVKAPNIESTASLGLTPSGYSVRAYYESDPESDDGAGRSDVSMLVISPPPKRGSRPASVRSRPARFHLRRYLGEPRNGLPLPPTVRPA